MELVMRMVKDFIRVFFLGILLFTGGFTLVEPALASPIHEAAVAGDVELVEMLIENGADVDDRDVHGYTPLLLAIQAGHTDIAKVLIAGGADVNARAVSDGGEDVTPLYLSIILGRRFTETLLLENGATALVPPANSSPQSPSK
jgi:ankyrin repeat protein